MHREDAVGIVVESLTNGEMRGPVNVTAPNPVRMGEMCDALRARERSHWVKGLAWREGDVVPC